MTDRTPHRLRIAVDFDGVLFDHVPYVLRGFRDRYGIDLLDEGLRHWDFYHYQAVKDADLPPSKVHGLLRDVETDRLLHLEPPLDADAAGVMGGWIAEGHSVEVVTARSLEAEETTRMFLRHHGIPHTGLRMGVRLKTGWDVLVDDAPHNVLTAAADGTRAFLMDHPYNRDVPTRTNPLRVRGWREVGEAVAALGGPARARGVPIVTQ
jgi:uncharacterized HAD superfamily protein